MAKKNMDEVKQLIDLGKEKGFLTFDEVNDILPPDIATEQIDDVMGMFGDMDIEIVDSAQKVKIPKMKIDLEEDEEVEGESEEIEFEPGSIGRTSDPVRMYLREMGSVSLLTREGEVEIAKRIEDGERDVASVILNTPITVKEVLQLGEKLRKFQINASEISKEVEEEELEEDEEDVQKTRILHMIEAIEAQDTLIEELARSLGNATSAAKKKDIEKRFRAAKELQADQLSSLRLKDRHINKVAERLKELSVKVDKLMRELSDLEGLIPREKLKVLVDKLQDDEEKAGSDFKKLKLNAEETAKLEKRLRTGELLR